MNMTIGKKFGIIVVFVMILLPVLIITGWYFGTETKKLAERARAESAVFASEVKDMQRAAIQVQQEELTKSLKSISSLVDKSIYVNLIIGVTSCLFLFSLVYFLTLGINKNILL